MKEVEKAKKIAEISKKIDAAKSELKSRKEYLESDSRFHRDTTISASDVKSAARKVEHLNKELDRLK